ncbi:MAG: sugar phosphate isomerase/epimerase [Rhizobiaceae bacterium]|nr:sugar phosphate isomerase/epimerase [Rhizobiaceae bacterium]
MQPHKRIAVSSWSVHRLLGTTHPHDLGTDAIGRREETFGPARIDLLDLPALVAQHSVGRLELCSFHLPSREPAYLAEMKAACASAGVILQTLLIEAGDLSDPATAERDRRWIGGWVDVAAGLGAENARIIAGKQKPTAEALALSAKNLRQLADDHAGSPVRLVTENWFALLPSPREVHQLLDAAEGRIGLNGDFGNWTGPGKYEALAAIFGRASICHAKASFAGGAMDAEDYGRCLEAAEGAGYSGPYTLIFDNDAPDEWAGIAIERDFISHRLTT